MHSYNVKDNTPQFPKYCSFAEHVTEMSMDNLKHNNENRRNFNKAFIFYTL